MSTFILDQQRNNQGDADLAALDEVVRLTRDMVRIPSLSGQEQAMARYVQDTMQALGFDDIHQDENGSVIGLVGPADAPVTLLFDSHMDVVPIAGRWTVEPFGGEIRDGRLYGRGATDMKGGLAAALSAVSQAARHNTLRQRIAVSASVMEEVIEGHALSAVLDRYQPRAVVICEPSGLRIKIGQKGRTEVLLTLHGQPSHAALQTDAVNPILSAALAMTALANLELPSHRHLGQAILVPTDIISDPWPSISLTPSSVTIRFDRRTLEGETEDEVLAQISDCLQRHGIQDFTLAVSGGPIQAYTGKSADPKRHLPAWMLPEDHELVDALTQAVESCGLPSDFSTWPFCTNGSESAGRRRIPTIGLGPGNEKDAHTADESVDLEQLIQARNVYRHLCRLLATIHEETPVDE